MNRIEIKNNIQNWNGIKELQDQIILGPQADILSSLARINTRYKSNFGITKTFRWSPGFTKERNRVVLEMLGLNKKGKTTTYSNRIDNSQWYRTHLFNNLIAAENSLSNLRNNNILFQDNTDIVNDIITFIRNKIEQELLVVNQAFSHKCSLSTYITDSTPDGEYSSAIAIEWSMKPYNIQYYPSVYAKEAIDIPANKTMIVGFIPMVPLLTHLGKYLADNQDIDQDVALENGLLSFNQMKIKGIYDNQYKLKHPYICPRWETSGREEYINPNTETTHMLHNTCTGTYDNLGRLITQFDLVSATNIIIQWLSRFIEGKTNPLNNMKYTFAGKPAGLENTSLLSDRSEFRCFNLKVKTDYCKSIDCTLKDTCLRNELANDSTTANIDEDKLHLFCTSFFQYYFRNDNHAERLILDLLSDNETIQTLASAMYETMSYHGSICDLIYSLMQHAYDWDDYEVHVEYFKVWHHDTCKSYYSLEEYYEQYDLFLNTPMQSDPESEDCLKEDTREADMMIWLNSNNISLENVNQTLNEVF